MARVKLAAENGSGRECECMKGAGLKNYVNKSLLLQERDGDRKFNLLATIPPPPPLICCATCSHTYICVHCCSSSTLGTLESSPASPPTVECVFLFVVGQTSLVYKIRVPPPMVPSSSPSTLSWICNNKGCCFIPRCWKTIGIRKVIISIIILTTSHCLQPSEHRFFRCSDYINFSSSEWF